MHIHILGICGTFMGGIAAIARAAGHKVTGCDANVYPPMSTQLQAQGIDAFGPLPPDTMFHAAARARYDVAICMYHDQGLIPAKTLAFDSGVNTTLGLPFIRTSPDHGTAFDIAGQNKADPGSTIAAIRTAAKLATPETPT